ncbi:MAG TPA: glycoside hydrolase family 18 protein [Granulicella sp.]
MAPLLKLATVVLLAASSLCSFAQTAIRPQASAGRFLLTGYFPQWGLYNEPKYLVKSLADSGGAAMLDQLNYAQAFVTNGHCSIADPRADLHYTFTAEQSIDGVADSPDQPFRGNLHQLVALKRRYPRLKIIISLEGRATDFALDAKPENRAAFIDSCVDIFLKGHLAPGIEAPGLFDGIDIDWEYPHSEDAENYLALLTELREKMDEVRPGLRLNIAVGHSPRMYGSINFAQVAALVDQVGLMTYDFHGPWERTTGFLAPLRAGSSYRGNTVERSVQAYLEAGVPSAKLLLGIPFYGYGWKLVPEENNGLFQEGQAIRGDLPYPAIAEKLASSTLYRDDTSQAPWLFDGDAFWTYEDPVSIHRKTEFARQQHLGGLMIWELGEDTSTAYLLRSAHSAISASSVGITAAPALRPAVVAAPPLVR